MAINANATSITANLNADDLALNYIYPTLENVSVLIPGVTINQEVSVEVGAASAFYYKNDDPVVTEGAAGRQLTTNAAGNYRVDILLNRSLQVDELIPHAGAFAIGVDIIGDYLVKAAIKAANAWGKLGLIKILNNATAVTGTASTKSTIYSNIIDTIAAFDTANPERALGANYVIVTPTSLALLRKSDEFVSNTQTGGILTDGIVGSVGGLTVIMSKQLPTIVHGDLSNYSALAGVEFIVGAADAFVAPTGFKNFRTIESEHYFGVKIQAEIVYGFDVADANRLFFRAVTATPQA